MKYFRNIDLIKLYNVSDKAVRNWIQGAQAEKLNLDLYEEKGKVFIADTIHNSQALDVLVQRGRKYRNYRNYAKLEPQPDFYSLFNRKQIINIINSLEKHHEFPQQYRYFGEGATYWDEYLHKLHTAGTGNLLTATTSLLKLDQEYLDTLLHEFRYINIVDLGVGNGLAVKDLLGHLAALDKVGKYIGIDASKDLLEITKTNLEAWFDKKVPVETYVRDLNYEQFADIIATSPGHGTVNLILFTGGILGNFRRPDNALNTIRESMGKNDVLITSLKLDSANTRRFFDFNIQSDKTALSRRNALPLEYLSVKEAHYEVEQFFDEAQSSRFIQVKLKIDLSIEFKLNDFSKIIEFKKGDTIRLFSSREFTDLALLQFYNENELSQLRTTLSHNREYVLLISRSKSNLPSI